MTQIKAILNKVFNSPYLDKGDVVAVVTAAVVLFKLPLDPAQQGAAVVLLGAAYVVAHKITNANKP